MCPNLEEFVRILSPNEKPRAVIIGSPPMFSGTLQKGRDIEVEILKHFPGVPLFVEKPIATGPQEEMEQSLKIAKMISDSRTICSVGWVEVPSILPGPRC